MKRKMPIKEREWLRARKHRLLMQLENWCDDAEPYLPGTVVLLRSFLAGHPILNRKPKNKGR